MYLGKESLFNLVEMGAKLPNGKGFTRNNVISESDIDDFRNRFNNTDVYATLYRYETPNQSESDLVAPMYFDLDNSDLKDKEYSGVAFESVREDALKIVAILKAIYHINEEYIRVYFSGGKGVHILVPEAVLGVQPRRDLNKIFKLIAMDIREYLQNETMDIGIYDNKRLFRLENSKHGESGLYKIPISVNELREMSFSDISLLASRPREFKYQEPIYSSKANRMYQKFIRKHEENCRKRESQGNSSKKTYGGKFDINNKPPCIDFLFQEGVYEGNRNNLLAVISSFYKQKGIIEAENLTLMLKFNKGKVNPPLVESEVVSIVESMYRGGYEYGCTTLEDMGLCNKDNCKIAKHKEAIVEGKNGEQQ